MNIKQLKKIRHELETEKDFLQHEGDLTNRLRTKFIDQIELIDNLIEEEKCH